MKKQKKLHPAAWNEVYINGEWRWYDATYGPNNENEQSAYADDRRY